MNSRAIRSQKLYRSDIYQYMNRDEKFVFVYLCTTDLLTLTPFLKITDKQISFDTDLDIPTVQNVLKSLEEKGLFLRYNDWIFFIHDFAQFEYKNTDRVKTKFLQELKSLPTDLLRYVHQCYSNRVRTEFEWHSNQYQIPNTKYRISNTEYQISTTLEVIEKLVSRTNSLPEKEKEEKEKEVSPETLTDFDRWIARYCELFERTYDNTWAKKSLCELYEARRAEGFSQEDLLKAIEGAYERSGEYADGRTVTITPERILRESMSVETYRLQNIPDVNF